MAVKIKCSKPSEFAAHFGPKTASPIVGNVSVTTKTATGEKTVAKEEHLHPGVITPDKELIRLTVEGGSTVNLGNYESARISVQLQVPTTASELEAAYDWCADWISKKIEAAVKSAKGEA